MRLRNMVAAMTTLVVAFVVAPVLSSPPCHAAAGWTVNGVGVRALKSTASDALAPQIAPDGAGGAIVAWLDTRSVKWDIYAQRVDVAGKAMWKADGVGIRAQPGTPNNAFNHSVA